MACNDRDRRTADEHATQSNYAHTLMTLEADFTIRHAPEVKFNKLIVYFGTEIRKENSKVFVFQLLRNELLISTALPPPAYVLSQNE